MKEFIEKLIDKIENEAFAVQLEKGIKHPSTLDAMMENFSVFRIKEIVNQLAEEYNNGWISVDDALPELTEGTKYFKQSKCCYVTLKWWDGDITEGVGWYNQSGVWNDDSEKCKVIAWKPIASYKPKGE